MQRRLAAPVVLIAFVVGCLIVSRLLKHETAHAAESDSIVISSTVPSELNEQHGGAPAATLQQAANFAWEEFIALNWSAVKQTGAENTRDTPDNSCAFGDPKC